MHANCWDCGFHNITKTLLCNDAHDVLCALSNIPGRVFSHPECRGCHVLHSTRGWILWKHSLKLLVLQGSIWSVCQIKLQSFASVRKTTLGTAVFWLLWLTYNSLWPRGLAGCSLTSSSHNPSLCCFSLLLFFYIFLSVLYILMYACVWYDKEQYLNFSLASEKLSEIK